MLFLPLENDKGFGVSDNVRLMHSEIRYDRYYLGRISPCICSDFNSKPSSSVCHGPVCNAVTDKIRVWNNNFCTIIGNNFAGANTNIRYGAFETFSFNDITHQNGSLKD